MSKTFEYGILMCAQCWNKKFLHQY